MAGDGPGGPHGVHLTRTAESVAEIDALADLLGGRTGLAGVLDGLDRQARRSWTGRLAGRAVDAAYAWERRDGRDPRWWPQGISSSADASDTETVLGRRLLVVSWYSKHLAGAGHGSRLTFLDLDTLRYRHVLLVVPGLDDEGRAGVEPLEVHAGGIVWCGPHVHVAATSRGFVTCRLEDVVRAGPGVESFGHDLLLPVRFSYRAHTEHGCEKLRYSFLSLDRGAGSDQPSTLVAGEYGRGGASRRLARFDIDPGSALLRADDDGAARPVELDDRGVVQMQGAVRARGQLHVTVSRGPWVPGTVYAGGPGDFRAHRFAVPMGPEDLSYWPSTDRLWSVSEHPRRRWVFSVPRSRVD